jgi:hypothetical protein
MDLQGKNLQETNEVIDGFEAEISAVEGAIADGKIDVKDSKEIILRLPAFVRGINGCWNVPAEIAGATSEQRAEVAARAAGLVPRAWAAHSKLIEILAAKHAA